MFKDTQAYSGFAVDDLDRAREFYGETLGIETNVLDDQNGLLQLELSGGDRPTLVYAKPDFAPATYTILNFPVEDVDAAVDTLAERGVEFERYEGMEQDEKGISRRPRPDDRLVQGPGGQHPLRPRGRLGLGQEGAAGRRDPERLGALDDHGRGELGHRRGAGFAHRRGEVVPGRGDAADPASVAEAGGPAELGSAGGDLVGGQLAERPLALAVVDRRRQDLGGIGAHREPPPAIAIATWP